MNGHRGPSPRAGIGLRDPHVGQLLATRPAVPWLEVHPENYMGGGTALASLEAVRRDYPVSLHGVGLSLGTAGAMDGRHLARLRSLVDRIEPCLVSEHLSWSTVGGTYLNHLLPLPYTEETLDVVVAHVREAQDVLGRRLLVENPSSYLRFRHSSIAEPHFLAELVRRTGCGLLCDINNVYVSAWNLGLDAEAYLDALPAGAVGEIHLAGHAENEADGRSILIDDHGSAVATPVWALYRRALERFGPVPTLIERDTNIPDLAVLLGEADTANRLLDAVTGEDDRARAA
ncbi:MAG TPA: DUF692 domain-containing protein [Methylomirabilota bacterium]|nr:DUF692 domain-containing protein [Methylomirabilota bacterium]